MVGTARIWLGMTIGAFALACRGEPPTPFDSAGADGSGRAGSASFGGAAGERRSGASSGSASNGLTGSEGAETTRGVGTLPAHEGDPSTGGTSASAPPAAAGATDARRMGDGGATAAAPVKGDTETDTGMGGAAGANGAGGSGAGTGGDDERDPVADEEQRYARVDARPRHRWR